ncbi:hypothetical protein LTR29_010453 [Friedmanniomyces endolithicus]|nr:hypothetical protein LTR29_010453 [Friedmanniomyces endolithicus]
MTNLADLIHIIPPDRDEEPEDIFASAPGLIFTDDTRNHHGDPGSIIVYKSKRFGDIQLRTADPEREDERQLFSHYLWNAGVKMAELISSLATEDAHWNTEGERVLELGAGVINLQDHVEPLTNKRVPGVGLDGIIATLSGAEEAGTP